MECTFNLLMRKADNKITNALNTEDLWKLMLRRVPPIVSEYFRGGADNEITMRANVRAFQQSLTTAHGALNFPNLDMSTTVAGQKLSVPWFISPVGSLRSLYPKADSIASKVAGEYGTLMCLSTLSGTTLEEVAAASSGNCWFQLYLCGGKDTALRGIERAKKAGFKGLILTMDTGVSGMRTMHARMKPMEAAASFNGLKISEKIKLAFKKLCISPQMLRRLPWLINHFRDGGLIKFVNVIDCEGNPMPYTDIGEQLAASAVTWDDLKWIKEAWGNDNPLIVKGVHCAQDAKRSEDLGATGVIWSNHGGRQQDRVPPTLHIVAKEMPLVGKTNLDFMMDGGIRNGTDILIALSYGFKAVGIGRVTAAGVGAGGYEGLSKAFNILHSELDRAMRLVGVKSIEEIHSQGEALRREDQLLGDGHLPPFQF